MEQQGAGHLREAQRTSVEIDARGVVVRIVGAVTGPSMRAWVDEMAGHPDFDPSLPAVWDFTEAVGLWGMTTAELKAGGAVLGQLRRGGGRPRVALVTPRDADYGVARMFEGLNADAIEVEMRVVRSLEEGVSWAFDPDARAPDAGEAPSE